MATLSEIVSTIRNYPGVTRKRPIAKVLETMPLARNAYFDLEVLAAAGDDSAAFEISSEVEGSAVYLLAADGIMRSLIDIDPYWGGYVSVLVNVNDIVAMGGLPLAMVNVLCTTTEDIQKEVIRGINDGCEKFGVAMVGGHTHPDGETDSISVAILGIVPKDCLITSHGANEGDSLIFALDMDGQVTPGIPYSFDTTSHKTPEAVQAQLKAIGVLAGMKIISSGKDLSNPGMLGTVGMLMETSGKGCVIDLDAIPRPESLEFSHWLTVYQGCGFVLTTAPGNEKVVADVLEEVGLTVSVCGTVTGDSIVIIRQGEDDAVLFDLNTDFITGAKPKDIKS